MKVGVISDTHDHLEAIEKAMKIFKEQKTEMIVHGGDWVSPYTLDFFQNLRKDFNVPVYGVIGNNTGDLKRIFESNQISKSPIIFPKQLALELEIESRKAVIFHGHDKPLLQALIDAQKYDVVFTGHTHKVRNEVIGKTLVFNPGSTSYASEGKIIKEATVGIYNSLTNTAEVIYLD